MMRGAAGDNDSLYLSVQGAVDEPECISEVLHVVQYNRNVELGKNHKVIAHY